MKPIIAITIGDASGCGPEIVVKALMEEEVYRRCRPLVIGDAAIMERARDIVGAAARIHACHDVAEGVFQHGVIDVYDLHNLPPDLPFARVQAAAGRAAYEYLEQAVALYRQGQMHALATAPLNKEALAKAGIHFPGHTEILAHLTDTKDYAMMLTGGNLRVIHVTTHVALRQACDLVKRERVLTVIKLAQQAMRQMGIDKPRIAVAGLNPHSGEGGLFGREEQTEIIPAIEEAKSLGLHVQGPVSPDTVFYRAAVKGDFDIVVCMYHDQGHIPIKVLGFATGVNITVGLPFLRTSVDHGTAFGKAGKGTADHQSMLEAILLAARAAAVTPTAGKNDEGE